MDDQPQRICINVNGHDRPLDVRPEQSLLDVLREDLDLTGAKMACDDGECGSCFVLLGNKPVMSCKLAATRAEGKAVTTIEGLGEGGERLHPIQEAFLECGATQCGFCIPGMIMRTEALLRVNPAPGRADIVKSLSRNLCRCTGYTKIIEAVEYAAELRRGGGRRNWADRGRGRGVGVSVPRLDSPATVTGEARYAADLKRPGMLHAKVLRSPHDHALIRSIDTGKARAFPGVAAVVTAADIPGIAAMSNGQPQTYLFPADRTRFKGEAIAAVAAESEAAAACAAAAIEVDYEPLPPVIGIEDGLSPEAPSLYPPVANVSPENRFEDGDVERGFAEADAVVEDSFATARREHGAMEPEAALAYLDDDDTLVIESPLYHPFVQGQESIAGNLALDKERVRILCPAMGGNFGKRGDALCATVAGLLALKTRRPVRLVYLRSESILGSSKTPGTRMTYRIGARRDGRIVAMEATVHRDVGCWAPHLTDVTTKGHELCCYESMASVLSHITGPYEIPNVRATLYDIVTNGPRAVPLRGTSGGYLPFAIETLLDRLADKLDMNPLELRMRNALGVGSRTHLGQVFKDSIGFREELGMLRGRYDDARRTRRSNGDLDAGWKHGVGLGCGWRSITYVNMPDVNAAAELLDDGRIEALAGSVEQGQGVTTQFAQIISQAFGLPLDRVVVTIGDTRDAPYPVPTFSSITTLVTGKALLNGAEALRAALAEVAAPILEVPVEDILFEDGFAFAEGRRGRLLSLSELAPELDRAGLPRRHVGTYVWEGRAKGRATLSSDGEAPEIVYGFNAAMAEVAVNETTGQVRVLRLVNAADPGTIIHPQALEGQIEGALAFGVGIALSESFHPDQKPNFRSYGLPSTREAAEQVEMLWVEDPCPKGPYGAKSAGEMSIIAPVPAIINAIADATGAMVRELPAAPERVRAALEAREA